MSDYLIEFISGCIVLKGIPNPKSVPIEAITTLQKLLTKNGKEIMDFDLARIFDANVVTGTKTNLKKLDQHPITLERRQQYRLTLPVNYPQPVIDWYLYGEVGTSSESIVHYLLSPHQSGMERTYPTPSDIADFRRCALLLERAPILAERLHTMAAASPDWAKLIKNWPAIHTTMNEECPDWRENLDATPRAYALLKNLHAEDADTPL